MRNLLPSENLRQTAGACCAVLRPFLKQMFLFFPKKKLQIIRKKTHNKSSHSGKLQKHLCLVFFTIYMPYYIIEENGETAFILTQDIIDSFKKSVGTAVYVSENGFGGQDGGGVYIDGGTFTIRKKKKLASAHTQNIPAVNCRFSAARAECSANARAGDAVSSIFKYRFLLYNNVQLVSDAIGSK